MKPITYIRCMVPFTHLTVNPRGYCYSCCQSWTKIGNIGKLTNQNSIMEIWNNERMQYIRKAILDDKLEQVCNFDYCPHAQKNQYFNLEAMKNNDPNFNHTIDQIMAGRTVLENPPYTFGISHSGKCNLRCIMCGAYDVFSKKDNRLDEKVFSQIIPEILPYISRLFLIGSGEVFFNQYSRKFLQSGDSSRYPSLRIELLTNGTMFTSKLWESIRHNQYESISVSIDAASKETYEKIRRNGNWDILRRNLDFISELRRQYIFNWFSINFCVMKSNYTEMKNFVELGLDLGCDKIIFQKVVTPRDIRENIFFTNNQKIFAAIARTLADPIFSRPEVDAVLLNEYRKYEDKTILFRERFMTKIKEWIFYVPNQMGFWMTKYFVFLLDVKMFFEKKRIPVKNQRVRPSHG